jgi:uncharacterized protein YifE (UPF0438 family)
MTDIPPDHHLYLQRRPFVFRCSTAVFPPDELEMLAQYDNWLEALAAGTIQPVSPEQRHFLKVDQELADPITLLERAWVRLKGRREYEQEQQEQHQQTAPPEVPAENYGIVEWDADRCWW